MAPDSGPLHKIILFVILDKTEDLRYGFCESESRYFTTRTECFDRMTKYNLQPTCNPTTIIQNKVDYLKKLKTIFPKKNITPETYHKL